MMGSCEHGNKPSDSIKGQEIDQIILLEKVFAL
jgi:hypothetical protein